MAERWQIIAAKDDRSLVEIRHSDGAVWIREEMTREESMHAIQELARAVFTLQQTLAVR